jgi:hypothetical protein
LRASESSAPTLGRGNRFRASETTTIFDERPAELFAELPAHITDVGRAFYASPHMLRAADTILRRPSFPFDAKPDRYVVSTGSRACAGCSCLLPP